MDEEPIIKFSQPFAYGAIYIFFTAYALALKQTEAASRRIEFLFTRLQGIKSTLEDYALRVEEMTVFEERNRLALELHDSVTQSIFGVTFLVRSTRLLLEQGSEEVTPTLEQLQQLAQNALKTMRSVIEELRPASSKEENLISPRPGNTIVPAMMDDLDEDPLFAEQSIITRYAIQDKLLVLISYFWIIPISIVGVSLFPDDSSLIIGIGIWFGLVMFFEPPISRRLPWFADLYPVVQMVPIVALYLYFPDGSDLWDNYFIPLGLFAIRTFTPRRRFLWIAILALGSGLAVSITSGWNEGIEAVGVTATLLLLIASYVSAFKHARVVQQESQELLANLRQANRQLKDHITRTEALAAIKERNRLARELHDSATQSIFSMTLLTKSTLILQERDPAQVEEKLDQLQALAQSALTEMRELTYQLRPIPIVEEGLIPALRRHFADLANRDQLMVNLVAEEQSLPLDQQQQQELFRIIQEALNNVIKHSRTDHAVVNCSIMDDHVKVMIIDKGVGFDMSSNTQDRLHLGLDSMRERAKEADGKIVFDSSPGQGTTVSILIPRILKAEDDG
jgi:signal transduction histidine kinase